MDLNVVIFPHRKIILKLIIGVEIVLCRQYIDTPLIYIDLCSLGKLWLTRDLAHLYGTSPLIRLFFDFSCAGI